MMIYIGEYYKLNPSDHGQIIGRCIGESKVCDKTYIFEFYYKNWDGWKFEKGSFGFWNIGVASELEVQKYSLQRELEGRLPNKIKKILSL